MVRTVLFTFLSITLFNPSAYALKASARTRIAKFENNSFSDSIIVAKAACKKTRCLMKFYDGSEDKLIVTTTVDFKIKKMSMRPPSKKAEVMTLEQHNDSLNNVQTVARSQRVTKTKSGQNCQHYTSTDDGGNRVNFCLVQSLYQNPTKASRTYLEYFNQLILTQKGFEKEFLQLLQNSVVHRSQTYSTKDKRVVKDHVITSLEI